MALDELAGEGLPADGLEAAPRAATATPQGVAAAMAPLVVGQAAIAAQPLHLLTRRPIRNGNYSNGVLTELSNGVLTNRVIGSVSLEHN